MKELSNGIIYREQRSFGVSPEGARKIEILFWEFHDKIHPPTAYERNMKASFNGECGGDYASSFFETFNEINKGS